mmetsp:Transcript_26967/g.59192  ORF Transcript_26967/g.59192 Transcript_26967/m.59192 type:complete len:529 (+) Transcript_26967:51-1637(+)
MHGRSLFLVLAAANFGVEVGASARSLRLRQGHATPKLPEKPCRVLCEAASKKDTYVRECLASCRVRYDVAPEPRIHVLREVASELGPRGRKAFQEMTGEAVPACHPVEKPDQLVINFEDVDMDKDGYISLTEALSSGEKMCVPAMRVKELFAKADTDEDGLLDPEEFLSMGESTVLEYEISKFAQCPKVAAEGSPGNSTNDTAGNATSFESLDGDGDGILEEDELEGAFLKMLIEKYPEVDDNEDFSEQVHALFQESIDEMISMADFNGDGSITRAEFEEWTAHTFAEQEAAEAAYEEAAKENETAEDSEENVTDTAVDEESVAKEHEADQQGDGEEEEKESAEETHSEAGGTAAQEDSSPESTEEKEGVEETHDEAEAKAAEDKTVQEEASHDVAEDTEHEKATEEKAADEKVADETAADEKPAEEEASNEVAEDTEEMAPEEEEAEEEEEHGHGHDEAHEVTEPTALAAKFLASSPHEDPVWQAKVESAWKEVALSGVPMANRLFLKARVAAPDRDSVAHRHHSAH